MLPVAFVQPALAQSEPTSTERALEQLRNVLRGDENLSPATREAFQTFATAMLAELAGKRVADGSPTPPAQGDYETIVSVVDERLDERLAEDEKPAWAQTLERLNIYGDFRLRHESSFNLDDKSDRHRERLRFRLRLDYQLSDEVLLGIGLRTGDPDDPNSAFVTFGGGFNDFDISLDRVLVTYRPHWGDGLWVTAGKFVNPIHRNPVYGELVWDADVNPEGVVLGYSVTGGDTLERFDLLVGGYTIIEDAASDDVWLLSAEVAARLRLRDDLRMDLSLGYDYYTDSHSALVSDNAGNAVLGGELVSDFGIIHPIAALTIDGWDRPLTVAVEYFFNHRADISEDTGYAIGANWGKTTGKGDWRIYYQWQVVEQDSVFSAFAQDDFLLQTNFRGHVFGVHYLLGNNIDVHLWSLVTARDDTSAGSMTDSDQDQWRIRADLTIKF